jgi:DNA polymerase delta subunit 1
VDPDILVGYNILNFDFPYLVQRAETLKLKKFMMWGRIRSQPLRMKDAQFSSKAYGTHAYKDISIEGRVQFDLLTAIQRDHKLSSYSLNNVAAHFLGAIIIWSICAIQKDKRQVCVCCSVQRDRFRATFRHSCV